MSSDHEPGRPRTLYLLKRAEGAVRAGLEIGLQPHGITPGQYVTLSLLASQRDQSSAELARKAGVTPQSMFETIATLMRKDLIVRAENPEHRRILMTRLTSGGETLLTECDRSVDAVERRLLADIDERQLNALRGMLRRIAAAAG